MQVPFGINSILIMKRIFWLLALVFVLAVVFLPGYSKLQELKERNRSLESKIKRLNMENALLQQELKRIEGDAFYQEKIAREKMGVVRKGEIPVKILPENTR